jgi:hypothetical protein
MQVPATAKPHFKHCSPLLCTKSLSYSGAKALLSVPGVRDTWYPSSHSAWSLTSEHPGLSLPCLELPASSFTYLCNSFLRSQNAHQLSASMSHPSAWESRPLGTASLLQSHICALLTQAHKIHESEHKTGTEQALC